MLPFDAISFYQDVGATGTTALLGSGPRTVLFGQISQYANAPNDHISLLCGSTEILDSHADPIVWADMNYYCNDTMSVSVSSTHADASVNFSYVTGNRTLFGYDQISSTTNAMVTLNSDIHLLNLLTIILLVIAGIDFIRRIIIPSKHSPTRYD